MSSIWARRRSPTIEKRLAHKLASMARKEVECVDKLVLNYWEVKYLFTKLNSFFSILQNNNYTQGQQVHVFSVNLSTSN